MAGRNVQELQKHSLNRMGDTYDMEMQEQDQQDHQISQSCLLLRIYHCSRRTQLL